MTNQQDYRLYLETEFLNLHYKLDGMEAKIDKINEIVHEHEKYIVYANGVIDARKKQIEEITTELAQVKRDIHDHPASCPYISLIKECKDKLNVINDNLTEYNFFKKYPKVAVLIISVALFTSLAGSIGAFVTTSKHLKSLREEVDMINTPVRTRGGTIQWWPSGVAIDSTKAEATK